MVCLNTVFYCGTSSDTESRIVTLIILQVDSAFYDTARCNEANNIPQKTETEDRIMDPFVKVSRPQVAVPRGRRVCCLSRRVGILPSQVADKAYLPPSHMDLLLSLTHECTRAEQLDDDDNETDQDAQERCPRNVCAFTGP